MEVLSIRPLPPGATYNVFEMATYCGHLCLRDL